MTVVGEDEVLWVESEDLASCFNLFSVPDSWLQFFAYERPVARRDVGLPGEGITYVAIRSIPMGWHSAVDLVQAAVCDLVYDLAGVPAESEVRKDKPFPSGPDWSLVYLDSLDIVRTRPQSWQYHESEHHARLIQVCKDFGLSLNAGKQLAAMLSAPIQGGQLLGGSGWLAHHLSKSYGLLALSCGLLGGAVWTEEWLRHWVGGACFASIFRRPMFVVWQEVFTDIQQLSTGPRPLSDASVDEVIVFSALLPMCFTNLRARLSRTISCSDGSPYGGGAAEATEFQTSMCTGAMTHWVSVDLAKSTKRLQEEPAATPVTRVIESVLTTLSVGNEIDHLWALLSWADYRGCDVRLSTSELQGELRQTVPYPATVWNWKTVMSYPWFHENHINVLELEAFLLYLKRRTSRSSRGS